jgi:hypothetical protein
MQLGWLIDPIQASWFCFYLPLSLQRSRAPTSVAAAHFVPMNTRSCIQANLSAERRGTKRNSSATGVEWMDAPKCSSTRTRCYIHLSC